MSPSYNDSFGSFSSGGAGPSMSVSGPISSGDGNVALAPEKKTKRWPLVLLGFLFVVALAVGLISMAIPKEQSDAGSSVSAKTYQEAFNLYANDYLYGEVKTDEITAEYNEEVDSYFDKMIDEDNISSEYLDDLKEYYTAFLDLYKESSTENDEVLEILDKYKNELDLTIVYLKHDLVVRSDIIDTYLSSGKEATEEFIETKLQPYKDLGKIDDLSFYNYALSWAEKILELAETYSNLGCVSDGNLSYSCIYENDDENVEKISDEAAKDYYYVSRLLNDSRDDLYSQIFEINELIKGVQENE
ncbi:hypothetical protein IJJ05_01515 [Candidatus Saccharibacteria bacterium]|nr:hypothetical protein [Candidatus Saccharibacteria bacterium]